MKNLLTIGLSLFCFSVFAQYDCSSGRYKTRNFFAGFDKTLAVEFGENTAANGSGPQKLYMDVFEPTGDSETKRPAVIMAFGGTFINGDRTQVHPIAEELAKMGYVAVAVDYRIPVQPPFDKVEWTLAVMRGMHDIKAAVRYFYKDAKTNGNVFGVDTNNIFIGGASSGAISALHAAYFDKQSEVPSYMLNDTTGLGGPEGHSGNAGYSSDVAGVINYSGAIGDTLWIENNDIPIVSIHDDQDPTVPYDTREIAPNGFKTGLTTSGSRDITARCENTGTKNDLHTVLNSTGHVSYVVDDFDFTIEFTADFLSSLFCDAPSSIAENSSYPSFEVYPNPAKNQFTINFQNILGKESKVEMLNLTGQIVRTQKITSDQSVTIDKESLSPGIYFIRLTNDGASTTRKVTLL